MAADFLDNLSFLIVDDQEFIRRLVRQVLAVAGGRNAREASDGEMAWTMFKARPADIVVTNWVMEPGDRLELTHRIRKDKDSPNAFVPVIMMTGHSERFRVIQARDAGVTEIVIKPLAPKTLFNRIEAVIERPRRFVRVGEFFGPDRRRHKSEFDGDDRRGKGPAKKPDDDDAAAAAKESMKQDDVNALMNPDSDPGNGNQ